jgi:hypothetical protein
MTSNAVRDKIACRRSRQHIARHCVAKRACTRGRNATNARTRDHARARIKRECTAEWRELRSECARVEMNGMRSEVNINLCRFELQSAHDNGAYSAAALGVHRQQRAGRAQTERQSNGARRMCSCGQNNSTVTTDNVVIDTRQRAIIRHGMEQYGTASHCTTAPRRTAPHNAAHNRTPIHTLRNVD